jgi:hypothetical protein
MSKQKVIFNLLIISIIIFGLFLRLDQYWFNRSLWLDEAFFAVNFLQRDIWTILHLPLDYSHTHIAPPGFMLFTQLVVAWLGNYDYVLRLIPLISGCLALIWFYFLARLTVSPTAVIISLFLFAISTNLISYSVEFKQYSSDVLIAIMLLWLGIAWRETKLNLWNSLGLICLGSISLWFSYPAALILATIGSYWFWYALGRRTALLPLILIAFVWTVNLIILVLVVRNDGITASPIGEWLVIFWTEVFQGFMPALNTPEGQQWLGHKLIHIFRQPADLGEKAKYLPLALFVLGIIIAIRQNLYLLYIAVLPIILALILSYLHLYPFADRLILFLLPILYLVIAEAIAQFRLQIANYPAKLTTYALQLLLVIMLVYPIQNIGNKIEKQELKPLLEYLQINKSSNDKLYLYHWVEPAFRYYAPQYGFDYAQCNLISPIPQYIIKEVDYYRQKQAKTVYAINDVNCILGVNEQFHYSQMDLRQLIGQGRVWLLFTHHSPHELQQFLAYLDQIGQQLEMQQQFGAVLYLYQF